MKNPAAQFEPSAARAASLDSRMRDRLAQSLDYVFEQVGEHLGIYAEEAAGIVSDIRENIQSPHRFGAYYDMVTAIERDDLESAREFARELVAIGSGDPDTKLGTIEERKVGQRTTLDVLRRFCRSHSSRSCRSKYTRFPRGLKCGICARLVSLYRYDGEQSR